jgi:amino acid permease
MANNNQSEAAKTVEELCKTLVATAGLILTLLWTLAGNNPPAPIIAATVLLVVSIAASLLAVQFIVSKRQRNDSALTGGSVGIGFFIAWITFLVGTVLLLVAIFSRHRP